MKISLLAYIDPGLGLLAWQAFVGACLGLLFYLKKTRKWFVKQFQKLFGADKQPEEENAERVETRPK